MDGIHDKLKALCFSRRFWVMTIAAFTVMIIPNDKTCQGFLYTILIAAWIIGDSIRTTLSPMSEADQEFIRRVAENFKRMSGE